MYKAKAIDFSGMDNLIKKLTDLEEDVHAVVEQALMETAVKTTSRLQSVASNPATYPAGGKYSQGKTAETVRQPEIIWKSPDSGYVRYGMDTKDYKVPYYIMYGTAKFDASQDLRKAIISASIKKDFETDLEEALQKAVDKYD